MHDLQLVGFTTDRRGLILRTQDGTRADASFVVPVTDELVALVTELADEQAAGVDAADERAADVDAADEVEAPAVGADAPEEAVSRPRSLMSVRDIQARLRAGEPLSRIAAEAGVGEDWIERFAPPIRAEQRRIVERALERHLERSRSAPSAVPLRRAVGMALADKGIAYTVAAYEAAWSARLLGHDRWAVEFTYRHRGRDRTATWTYDADADVLTTSDRAAAQLGYVAPGSAAEGAGEAVDGIVGDLTATASRDASTQRAPDAAPVSPTTKEARAATKRTGATSSAGKKRAAKKPVAKKSTSRKKAAAKKAAPKRKAAAKKAAPKRKAVAKKAAPKRKAAAKKAAPRRKAAAKKAAPKRKAVAKKAAPRKKAAAKKSTSRKKATAERAAPKEPGAEQAATTVEHASGEVAAEQPAAPTQAPREVPARPTGAGVPAAPPADDVPRARPDTPRHVAGRPGEVPIADVPLAGRGAPAGTNGRPSGTRPVADGRGEPRPGGGTADPTSARRMRAVERNTSTVQFRSGSAAPVRAAGDADRGGGDGMTAADRTARPRPERGEPDGAAQPATRRRRQLRAR